MKSLVVLDFEGTSKLSSARATEIGLVSISEKFEILSEFESVIQAPIAPFKSALSVSRLSRAEISSAPTFGQLWPLLIHQLSEKILVSHNKIYEINVLQNELRDISIKQLPPFICTLEWSRKILGLKVKNHTLPTLCSFFDIELVQAHEALSDARATAALLHELTKLSPALVDEIDALSSQVVKYPELPINAIEPQVRERFHAEESNEDLLALAFQRVTKKRKTLVVVTGTPDEGKEEFRVVMAGVGLEYRETPPTLGAAFVVQANISPGMSKIRRAIELGVPVLSESDALLLVEKLKGL
ncbi:DnaQ DNA polymerase III, epsilon subunit and related 3'-5' exonucleases [Candidatus Nanopelagicaceae bacterium]